MKFTIQRAALIKPLQIVSGVVEKRQTLPILSNVLIKVEDKQISLIGTDLELEMIGSAILEDVEQPGVTTVSAKKLLEICRALPENALLKFSLESNHLLLRSGKSRFSLTTLPAQDFPSIEKSQFSSEITIAQNRLRKLISKIYFAMGQQDVRHYLNGALLDINQGTVRLVATDGHRLACSFIENEVTQANPARLILPRKSVLEFMRLLDADSEENVTLHLGENLFKLVAADFTLTSKLINAQYPNYEKLIPRNVSNIAITSREDLRQALSRAAILSNEKFRGIRVQFDKETMRVMANNPEQEEAEELIHHHYDGHATEIGFNVAYLLDVISSLGTEKIQLGFTDPNAGVLVESSDKTDSSLYVIMPMRL